jgi:hypothetical protein
MIANLLGGGTLLALGTFGPACGPDRTGETGGDFALGNPPTIEILPSSTSITVLTSGFSAGSVWEYKAQIVNTGTGELVISNIKLAGDAEYALDPAGSFPITLYTLNGGREPDTLDLRVSFTRPGDDALRQTTLRIDHNDPKAGRATEIKFATESGVPDLVTDKQVLDLALVPLGEEHWEKLSLLNVGSRRLLVSGFKLENDPRFKLRVTSGGTSFEIGGSYEAEKTLTLNPALQISPGTLSTVEIGFSSAVPTPAEGVLRIISDDPAEPAEGYAVNLIANKSGPCILTDPAVVNFGGKQVGKVHDIEVLVVSCGTEPLKISSVFIDPSSSADYELVLPEGMEPPTSASPLTIPVNESRLVTVRYIPDAENPLDPDNVPIPDEGTLIFESTAFHSVLEVPISGAANAGGCPVAVIQVKEGEEVAPQTVLHLDGSQSYAPFGAVTSWQWKVLQPEGSVSTLVPGPEAVAPIFSPNIVGVYTFILDVRDETGQWASKCGDVATFSVLVRNQHAVHIELVWKTPGDLDETDTGEGKGTDLDLHFTHPFADGPDLDGDGVPDPWFNDPYDCFFGNPTPSWGSFDPNVKDDPVLDRDDTDGGGPENMHLSAPEDLEYLIGVHFWNALDYGDVSATLRVFHYDDLVYEKVDVFMTDRDLWCVGRLKWPDVAVEPCGTGGAEKIVPDYVNPFYIQ